MKVSIDPNVCQGHTMCGIACPELFRFDSVLGNAYVLTESVPDGLAEKVRLAQAACPEGAIVITEEAAD